MRELKGAAASKGLGAGRALVLSDEGVPDVPRRRISAAEADAEMGRFLAARAAVKAQFDAKLAGGEKGETGGKEARAILESQAMMLDDPDFADEVRDRLFSGLQNVESAVRDTADGFERKLKSAGSDYFRERAADVSDAARALLKELLAPPVLSSLADNAAPSPAPVGTAPEGAVIVAHDLLPSQVFALDRERVKAVVLEAGSGISHTAILLRSFGIPAVFAVPQAASAVRAGELLLVDGGAGLVIAEPDKTALGLFEARLAASISSLVEPSQAGGSLHAETTDGRRFILKANLETAAEFARAKALGAEGVGLFRSEFLFLTGGAPPDEERQYAAYRAVIEAAAGLPVTVRTLDAGGDKAVPALADALPEANPLLGWRAIRFSLARPDIFKMQLRAILRASAHGKAALMFPLVCCYEELDAALALLDEAKRECSERGQPFDAQIPAGVMIELPAAALVAERLIERAAFFSIGTNDLLQYTLGVDRGNGRVNQLADPLHPAVLRLIRLTADAARSHGKSAAMCGEMAGDPALTRLLLGLGVDEFSMNAASIPEVRAVIRSSSLEDCRLLADRVLSCGSASEARAML